MFYVTLPEDINLISLEIFNEHHRFKKDRKIAWKEIKIPKAVFEGETVDEWFPVSGQTGYSAEGQGLVILIIQNLNLFYT